MTKYIFRSEKGKNTCDRCKSYDGKIYYDLKDAPTLPLHPNCRCYLEAVEDKTNSTNTCNCIAGVSQGENGNDEFPFATVELKKTFKRN